MVFGESLRKLRKAKGYTQKDLADKIFVTRQAVTKWENNQSIPDIETIKRIADVLEVSISELLDEDAKPEINKDEEQAEFDEKESPKAKKINIKNKKFSILLIISLLLLGVCLIFSIRGIVNYINYTNEHNAAKEEANKAIFVGAYYSFDEDISSDSLDEVLNADLPMVIFNGKKDLLGLKYFEYTDSDTFNLYLPVKKYKTIYEHIISYKRNSKEYKLDKVVEIDCTEFYGAEIHLFLEWDKKLYLNIIEPVKEVAIISHDINYEIISTDIIKFNEEGKLESSLNSSLNDYSIGTSYHISGAISYTLKLTYYDGYTKILNINNSGPNLIFINQPDSDIKNTSYMVWFILQ